jgi:hypothetical protein
MRVPWARTSFFLVVFGLVRTARGDASAAPLPGYPSALSVGPPAGISSAPYPDPIRPLVLRYERGSAAPPGYHLEENPRKGLVIAGALTFGVPYLISLTVGGASRHEADRWLLLPVVGPIGTLTYGMRGCDDTARCAGNILIVVGLAFDLAAQTAGALLFTMGYVLPKRQWVSDDDVSRRTPPNVAWSILPHLDAAGRMGLTLTGTGF